MTHLSRLSSDSARAPMDRDRGRSIPCPPRLFTISSFLLFPPLPLSLIHICVCLILAAALVLGLCFYVVRYVLYGGKWVSLAANRHLYNSAGQLSVGRVLDRDGDVLSWADENGNRCYYDGETVRKATLHAVGDASGKIGTGALVAFADQLSGYNLLTGAYSLQGTGNDLYLTLDARYNYIAYNALGGRCLLYTSRKTNSTGSPVSSLPRAGESR